MSLTRRKSITPIAIISAFSADGQQTIAQHVRAGVDAEDNALSVLLLLFSLGKIQIRDETRKTAP